MDKMEEILMEKALDKDGRAVLKRVIGDNGVPYSKIYVDGFEELSAQTLDEEKMLYYFRIHMLWMWDIELREDTDE